MDIKFSKIDTLKDLINTTIKNKLESINLIPEIKSNLSIHNYHDDSFQKQNLNANINEDNIDNKQSENNLLEYPLDIDSTYNINDNDINISKLS